MMTSPKRTFRRLRPRICPFLLVAVAAVILARIAVAVAVGERVQPDEQCDPIVLLLEYFDGVTPPALPTGWSSTTWVTSNSGVPAPPAITLPNAAFVDDPATISDKQLLSPNIGGIAGGGRTRFSFSNNFNLQDGFDGGVLEISFDGGLTFQDILAAGGTFGSGGYNGTISSCCGNPLAGRQAWTGNSGGFITTTVNLPYSSVPVTLRWRMGSDSGTSSEGWRIDSVVITQACPPTPRPARRPTPHPRPSPPR
ncbi:MAG: hypothetical protein J2P56_05840 [Verrucomicrobia bacterium]|nr:hypothetical protein [Verrucomicrobiota bacterium]